VGRGARVGRSADALRISVGCEAMPTPHLAVHGVVELVPGVVSANI